MFEQPISAREKHYQLGWYMLSRVMSTFLYKFFPQKTLLNINNSLILLKILVDQWGFSGPIQKNRKQTL